MCRHDIIDIIEGVFKAYMILFLLYLDWKFTKTENKTVHDPILKKPVPYIVFI